MEENPGSGQDSEWNSWGTSLKLLPLRARLQETLNQLSPQELRDFRTILKNVDVKPRVKELRLELEGSNAWGMAQLLAKYYDSQAAGRVMVQVLQQLPRADLLPRWQSAPPAVPEARQVIPRKMAKRSCDCVEDELERYDLSGKRKAFLMCVLKNRPGAQHDVQMMKKWLDYCRFEFESCIDPNKKEFLEKMRSFRDELNKIKDGIGCCLVTLMSHGEEGFIKMNNGENVSLEDIFEMFNNKNCPALQEKPKIFIIQACRGEKRDFGVETDDEPMDSDDGSEKRRLPTFSDYFIIYPTQAAHVALRHPDTGSVMITAMYDVFQEYGNKWHIADFFTKVNNRVVHREFNLRKEPVKVTLVMESTLTKFVYF
uniref:Caspase-14-like n=1 Tax=Catagonus wagneri TaxID=51154 RepID=A0A8C3WJH4_9CETA